MTTLAILETAQALIDSPEKWRQGCNDGSGRLCTADAIAMAAHQSGASVDEWFAARDLFRNRIDPGIPTWNDDPERTHAQVMEKFGEVIQAAMAIQRARS